MTQIQNETVNFGRDLETGCLLMLNESELRAACCEGSDSCSGVYDSVYVLPSGVPVFLQSLTG